MSDEKNINPIDPETVKITPDTYEQQSPEGSPVSSLSQDGTPAPECPTVEPTPVRETAEAPAQTAGDASASAAPVDDGSANEPPVAKRKPLSNKEVTDHTAGLWKYLPIPMDEPEPAPEYLQSDVKLPGGRVIAARVRGKKHKHEGTNCDDWYEVGNVGDVTFIAVSDGAGSKKFSRIGARESCRASVGYLVSAYEKLLQEVPALRDALKQELSSAECMEACGRIATLVQKSVIQAGDAVETAYYSRVTDPAYSRLLKRSLNLKDLSGTLLVAIVIPINSETGEHLIVTCQVGDGMIASINSKGPFQGSVKLLGVPDSGDFSGETEFLTASQVRTIEALRVRTKLSRGITDMVMLMSDGVADDYYPNETQMRRLYFDLLVNGVIDMENRPDSLSKLSPREISVFKKIPDPVLYPWVNDKSVTVPIQYTNRICDAMGITLEQLWEDRTILGLASLELKEAETSADLGERLRVWLDNYYERGSFDDRTLVVMQL